jgi:hypothetical protein
MPRACIIRCQHDLALRDVTGEIRDRMGDVPGRHGEHRQLRLGPGPLPALAHAVPARGRRRLSRE